MPSKETVFVLGRERKVIKVIAYKGKYITIPQAKATEKKEAAANNKRKALKKAAVKEAKAKKASATKASATKASATKASAKKTTVAKNTTSVDKPANLSNIKLTDLIKESHIQKEAGNIRYPYIQKVYPSTGRINAIHALNNYNSKFLVTIDMNYKMSESENKLFTYKVVYDENRKIKEFKFVGSKSSFSTGKNEYGNYIKKHLPSRYPGARLIFYGTWNKKK